MQIWYIPVDCMMSLTSSKIQNKRNYCSTGHEADGEVLSLPLVKIIAAIGHLQAKYCTENTCTKNLLCPEPAGGAYALPRPPSW